MRFLSAGPIGTAALLVASLAYVACAPADDSSDQGNPSTTTGGATGTGGAAATGGVTATGGAVATGGVTATGGAVGTGGVTATGGVTGTGGVVATGGAGTGGGGAVDCGSLPICDDFESNTAGAAPAGWTLRAVNGGTVVVDDAQAHSGTKSVKVKDGISFLVNSDVLPTPTGKIYVRSYMRWNEAVPESHTSYMSISGLTTDESQEMRFGGQHLVLNFNASMGDGLAPDPFKYPSCETCITPPVGKWVCVEVMFDYQNELATAWLKDDTGEKSFVVDDPSDFHAASTWPATVDALKIGYWAIGGATQTIWYDDIAVRYDDRVGCD